MPRKGPAPKRPLVVDPVYGSPLVTQLVNKILMDGKKSIAETIVYGALEGTRGQGGDGAPAAAFRGEPRPVGRLRALHGARRRRQPPVDRARPGIPGGRPPRRDLSRPRQPLARHRAARPNAGHHRSEERRGGKEG